MSAQKIPDEQYIIRVFKSDQAPLDGAQNALIGERTIRFHGFPKVPSKRLNRPNRRVTNGRVATVQQAIRQTESDNAL